MRVALLASIPLALLGACAPAPSLWGTYSEPTATVLPTLISSVTVQPIEPRPSPTPAMAATDPVTDTPEASATSTPAPLTGGGSDLDPSDTGLIPQADDPPVLYYAQSGDTLEAVARRFSVQTDQIRNDSPATESGFLPAGTLLIMPGGLEQSTAPHLQLLPDSEVVFSGTAVDFDLDSFVSTAGGRLAAHREYLGSTGWNTGIQEIQRLAYENSINPRLLLAILEYESRWVRGNPVDSVHRDYPMGYVNSYYKGLFGQMLWAVNQLSTGYYGWRTGSLTELQFPDGTRLRIDPTQNAGTVALQYLFSRLHNQSQWAQMIDPANGFLALYTDLFGDPWARAEAIGPVFPKALSQPPFELPFETGRTWSFTGGPHGAWEHDGALAAVDFAPFTDHGGCDSTPAWVTAAAPGVVVRADRGVVVQDLDGDGHEQTGWALVYLHIASAGRVEAGTYLQQDDRIGHPSCEGGQATGTHLHFVRKYNGEWVAADGPIPMALGGWQVRLGDQPYEGTLVNGDRTIIADPVGQSKSVVIRTANEE